MINYRIAKTPEEFERVAEYLKEKKSTLEITPGSIVLYAEEGSVIIAAASIKSVAYIESMASDNSLAAYTLFGMMQGIALQSGNNEVHLASSSENVELYKKLGFEKLNEKFTYMKKKF